ncbi:hypothetical protein TNCV_233611, partial [Trichonephila clavipes]
TGVAGEPAPNRLVENFRVSPKRHCCRVRAADNELSSFTRWIPRPDAVTRTIFWVYSGKSAVPGLPDDLPPPLLTPCVVWKHARIGVFLHAFMDPMLLCPVKGLVLQLQHRSDFN